MCLLSLTLSDSLTHSYADLTPWGVWFSHPITLAMFFYNFVFGFINFMLLSEMPSFLQDVSESE